MLVFHLPFAWLTVHCKNCWVTSTTSGLPQLHVSDTEERDLKIENRTKTLLNRHSEMMVGFNIMRSIIVLVHGCHNTCLQPTETAIEVEAT